MVVHGCPDPAVFVHGRVDHQRRRTAEQPLPLQVHGVHDREPSVHRRACQSEAAYRHDGTQTTIPVLYQNRINIQVNVADR